MLTHLVIIHPARCRHCWGLSLFASCNVVIDNSALFTYTFWSISGINYYFVITWQVHTRSTGVVDTACEVWPSYVIILMFFSRCGPKLQNHARRRSSRHSKLTASINHDQLGGATIVFPFGGDKPSHVVTFSVETLIRWYLLSQKLFVQCRLLNWQLNTSHNSHRQHSVYIPHHHYKNI